MKETSFIEKNKKKWHEFEKLSNEGASDPDKLQERFIQMTEDLSYARTFYPKRSVRVYLNYLAQKAQNSYTKKKKSDNSKLRRLNEEQLIIAVVLFIAGAGLGALATMWVGWGARIFVSLLAGFLFTLPMLIPRLRDFFFRSLPLEMYRSRKQLLAAFLFFSVAILIGVVSSHIDPEFSRVILGDYYVDMTLDNIANEDPMAVYKQMNETDMFLQITINNVRVAFLVFVFGFFFSVGSVFLLFSNGIMLGAFQYFFKIKGLLLTSFLVIWIHGALEISAIVIAGCAGMVVGNGLLFPKTLTRSQSLQLNARRGIKILIGTVPIFIVAGFLEGFVTRHTEMSDLAKWSIIIISFMFIIGYFVVYPFIVAKRENYDDKFVEKPIYQSPQVLRKYKIRDLGKVFYDSFGFFRMRFKQYGSILVKVILPINILLIILIYKNGVFSGYLMDQPENLGYAMGLGNDFNWIAFVGHTMLFSLNLATVHHALKHLENKSIVSYFGLWIREVWPFFLKSIPLVALLLVFIGQGPGWAIGLSIFVLPFILLVFYPATAGNFGNGLSKGMSYGAKSWGITFVVFLMIGVLCFLFSWVYYNPLFEGLDFGTILLSPIIEWHTITALDNFMMVKNIIWAVFYTSFIHLLLPLFFSSFAFQFFSMKEQEEGIELNKKLDKFGTASKVYEKVS